MATLSPKANLSCGFCYRVKEDIFPYYKRLQESDHTGNASKTHALTFACLQCLLQKITCNFVEKEKPHESQN